MEKRVLEYVKKHQLIEHGDHVIVGLSGGADSVCLLLMLKNLQTDLNFSASLDAEPATTAWTTPFMLPHLKKR